MRIAKGDTVMVIAGDDKGKSGKVLMVIPEKNRVIVEKINFVKRHIKPTQRNTQGGIQEKEAAVHLSNVQLVDPKTGEPTRIGVKRLPEGGRERIARKSGETLPRPGR
ncbi:MAG: 50S ribosomal protein L24 [Candidatus Eisenbacteria bacterium]|nr:50S ribosomal protein L24 [Candidatus Eisenbacteria bacterium]